VTKSVGGRADKRERDVLADAESQVGKSAQFSTTQRRRFIRAVLALNGPEFAFLGLRNKVDSFIAVRQFKVSPGFRRYFFYKPNMLQFRLVRRIKLKIVLCQEFKTVTLLLGGQRLDVGLEIAPVLRRF